MISYSPAQRWAVLGKNGSGKTFGTILIVCALVPFDSRDWQVWWLDTKHDPTDRALLHKWGFRVAGERQARATPRKIFDLRGNRAAVHEQAQLISDAALAQQGVLLVYDEYGQVCKSRIDAGPAIEDVHKRGRGLNVGSLGGVQEPAFVPRYLFSQANHLAIGNLTHLRDVKIARELNPSYAPGWPKEVGDTVPDKHGFWVKYLDGHGPEGQWWYWPRIDDWYAHVRRSVA